MNVAPASSGAAQPLPQPARHAFARAAATFARRRGLQALAVIVLATTVLLAGCAGAGQMTQPDAAALLKLERQADLAYRQDRNKQAAALYGTLVQAVPGEADYWYRLANSLARTGRYGPAVHAYQQTLVRDAEHGRAWHNLGVVRLLQAQAAFAKAVAHAPPGTPVFADSRRLSTAVFTLTEPGTDPPSAPDTPPKPALPTPPDQL